MTVTLTSSPIESSITVPKMISASSSAASIIRVTASFVSCIVRDSGPVIFIMIPVAPLIEISSRRQDGKVNLPQLLNKCITGFPNSEAGGHIKAAGGTFPEEYLEEFKKRLFSLV